MKKNFIFVGLTLVLTLFLVVPVFAQAPTFEPLARLPFGDKDHRTLTEYLNAIFWLLIAVSAVFAVVKIAIAGVRYMMTDAFGGKAAAIKDINEALIGLVLILSAYLILRIINPCIVDFQIFSGSQSNCTAKGSLEQPR